MDLILRGVDTIQGQNLRSSDPETYSVKVVHSPMTHEHGQHRTHNHGPPETYSDLDNPWEGIYQNANGRGHLCPDSIFGETYCECSGPILGGTNVLHKENDFSYSGQVNETVNGYTEIFV